MIYKLQTGKVLPIIRKIAKPISTAERLGIPKALRFNPKALEDPYYWGYQQWNSRYNAAVNSGNIQEAQRLRDLHFLSKTTTPITDPNGKLAHNYHATKANFTIFDPTKAGSGSGNLKNTPGVFYFTPYREASIDVFHPKGLEEYNKFNVIDAYINNPKPVILPLEDFKKTWFDAEAFAKLRDKGTGIIGRASSTPEEMFKKALEDYERRVKKNNGIPPKFAWKPTSPDDFMEEGLVDNIAITKPEFIKLADPITRTNTGEIIPIVKRDNFHNPDIRYKQGGKVKRQSEIPESAKAKSYFAGLKDYILHKTESFIPSQYKPTKGNNIQVQYYTRPGLKEEVALNLFGGTDKNAKNFMGDSNYFYKDFNEAYQDLSKEYIANSSRTASNGTLGEYGVSAGTDDNGRYISFIDNFDHVFIPGKGIPIYDRIYENEINSVYNKNRSAFDEGDWITKSPVLQKLKKKQTK